MNEKEPRIINNKPDRCPCCNRKMYKLKNEQWTHLISKALEENK